MEGGWQLWTIIQFVEMRFSAEKKIYRLSFLVSKEKLISGGFVAETAWWGDQCILPSPVTDIWETDGAEEESGLALPCPALLLVYRMVFSRLGQIPRLHHGYMSTELCILVFSFFLFDSQWKLYSGGNLR